MIPLDRLNLGFALFSVWLFAVLRAFGGTLLLWFLGAPGWAIAAWLMLHITVKLDPARSRGQSLEDA